MFGKKYLVLSSAALIMFAAGFASADTIIVQNANAGPDFQPQSNLGIYTYSVTFDTATDAETNDGFVIYNFAGETGWTLTPTSGSDGLTTSGSSIVGSMFALSTPSTGTGSLNYGTIAAGELAVLGGTDSVVPNLVFTYTGSTALGGPETALLTVYSQYASVNGSFAVGVDHSGSTDKGISGNGVIVAAPGKAATTPLPASVLGGSALLGLMAFAKTRSRKNSV